MYFRGRLQASLFVFLVTVFFLGTPGKWVNAYLTNCVCVLSQRRLIRSLSVKPVPYSYKRYLPRELGILRSLENLVHTL